ncbi:MAG TPA: urate hydroxylase PuuD [Candidatus Thermoplasmatota archaeon]|nr:urate hydroxylase PuuD [Candidatus Thermoplasmatota archaeon]
MATATASATKPKFAPSAPAMYIVMAAATILLIGDLVVLAGVYDAAPAEFSIGYRWVHIVAGILWIGLLYFFNFVNVPYTKEEAFAQVKSVHLTKLIKRALFWFRWSAMLTLLAGLGLLFADAKFYPITQNAGVLLGPAGLTITAGMALAIVMWFNVWFVIWPNQRRILEATETAGKVEPAWGKTALLASRVNTVFSFPMIFFMAASAHYPLPPVWIAGVFVLTAAAAWGMIHVTSKS